MTIVVSPLLAADAPRCAELERLLFPGDDPWPASAFRQEIAAKNTVYLAAREATQFGSTLDTPAAPLLGYAGLALLGRPGDGESEIHTIAVDPVAQRRGIGQLLLRALLREARDFGGEVFLEVRTDNDPAITLYRAHGFEIIATRKRYYSPSGADAYSMRVAAKTLGEQDLS